MKTYTRVAWLVLGGICALSNAGHAINIHSNTKVTVQNYLPIPVRVIFKDKNNNKIPTTPNSVSINGTAAEEKSVGITTATLAVPTNFVFEVIVETTPIWGKSKILARYTKQGGERPFGVIKIKKPATSPTITLIN